MDTKLQLMMAALTGVAAVVASSRAYFSRPQLNSFPTPRAAARPPRREQPRFAAPTPVASAPMRMDPIQDGGFSLVPFGEEAKVVAPAPAPRRASTAPAGARIRDRYILARFPGVMRKSEDFADTDAVIKAARLYFEDGLAVRGVELLQFASEMDPARESLWLARLQMYFMLRDARCFGATAKLMHQYHPKSTHWPQIAVLGRNLGLTEAFFAAMGMISWPPQKPGFWPDLPNWLLAPPDTSPHVAAGELRSRLLSATDVMKEPA